MSTDYLDQYELRLTTSLLDVAKQHHLADGPLDSADLQDCWATLAADYAVCAIPDFQDYPTVSLGWMMFVGMAMAHHWDHDWRGFCLGHPAPFAYLRDLRGWDCMDEAILGDVLRLSPQDADTYSQLTLTCARLAYDTLRHEQVEPGTPMALHIYTRTLRALYRTGIACELHRLHYHYEKL